MSDIEGEVKVSKEKEDKAEGSDVEVPRVDNTANYFEFARQTRSCARGKAKLVGLPERENFNLPTHSMTPANISRD